MSGTLWSPCLSLFLPEESSCLRRILIPVVSRGSACGHLGTQWRCLSLPPIPSIRMLVSAFAALCPPASGRQAHPARSVGTSWTPLTPPHSPPGSGPSSSPFSEALFPYEFGGGRGGLGASSLKEMGLSLRNGPGAGALGLGRTAERAAVGKPRRSSWRSIWCWDGAPARAELRAEECRGGGRILSPIIKRFRGQMPRTDGKRL